MKKLYVVKVEWQLKGKGETPLPTIVKVVAGTADQAVQAAIYQTRERFIQKLSFVRLAQVIEGETIDIVA